MRRYTQAERDTYWMTRCPECGWHGLSRDCDGFGPIGDTGDYNEGLCPRCGEEIVEDGRWDFQDYAKWFWRALTFWVARKKWKRKRDEEEWLESIGVQPEERHGRE